MSKDKDINYNGLPEELADRKLTPEEAVKIVQLINALMLFVDADDNDKDSVIAKLKEMKENTIHNVDIVLAEFEKQKQAGK